MEHGSDGWVRAREQLAAAARLRSKARGNLEDAHLAVAAARAAIKANPRTAAGWGGLASMFAAALTTRGP
jgi:hypothetical protein